MTVQWWCSAQTAAWSWSWQPYPGVWLFVAALAAAYLWLRGRPAAGGGAEGGGRGTSGRLPLDGRGRWFLAGLALTWLALDWPVGPLGAGYLASVHMVQVLVLSLVVPALFLLAIPRSAWSRLSSRLEARPLLARIVAAVTHPLTGLLLFNAVVVGTHFPLVLDTLSRSQLGMMAMELAWMAGGTIFWWPVLALVPERPWFGRFFQMGYLFLNSIPATVPYGFLVFSEFPLYAVYELAPPFPGISTVQDQQVAGFVMKLGGGLILWTSITILFFRWYREEGDETVRSSPSPS